MSFPYPQDRHRDRKEKGNQPYQDAKEAVATTDAELQSDAEEYGESQRDESAQPGRQFAVDAEKRLREIGNEVRESTDGADAS